MDEETAINFAKFIIERSEYLDEKERHENGVIDESSEEEKKEKEKQRLFEFANLVKNILQ